MLLSPRRSLSTKEGTGKRAHLCRALARAFVKVRLEQFPGEVKLTGPCRGEVMIFSIAPQRSSRLIHGKA